MDDVVVSMDAQAETLFQVGLSEADVVAGTGSEFGPSRLTALVAIVLRLQDVMKREAIQPWLNTGVPAPHMSKPIDLIGQGNTNPVMRLISGIRNGCFVTSSRPIWTRQMISPSAFSGTSWR